MTREPAVAGRFYPADARSLRHEISSMMPVAAAPQEALLAVCPHAGIIFSGGVAGAVLGRVKVPRHVLLMGPNHHGEGRPAAMMSRGWWRTPLGEVPLDERLGDLLSKHAPYVDEDESAHRFEHSLEVLVPFLQSRRPDFELLPICLSLLRLEDCLALGRAIAKAIGELGEPVLMVASTDMSHYISAQRAKAADDLAIERILALDPAGLHQTVLGKGISMCGVVPVTVGLAAALELGAAKAELAAYTHSGMVTGDDREVVAYAGLIVG